MGQTKKRLIAFLMVLCLLCGFMPQVKAAEPAEEPEEKFGTVEHISTYHSGDVLKDGFYYSDEWFIKEDSYTQNDHLALTSMQLIATVADAGNSERSVAFLNAMGFDNTGLSGFENDDSYGCSYAWGTRKVKDGGETYTIVAVAFQSYTFNPTAKELGWTQNFQVNGDVIADEHYTFSSAAESKYADIAALGGSGHVKYWITGHSRGGAIAGIVAQRLNTVAGIPAGDIYAYTFEAPAEVEASAVPDNAESYGFIHNYVCDDDIVTMIPPWGMVRYGVDYKLNTAEVNAQTFKKLEDMKSAAVEKKGDDPISAETVANMVGVLQSGIPTREEYSALHEETVTNGQGEEVNISYVYQDVFMKLIKLVFGENPINIPVGELAEKLGELPPVVAHLVAGMRNGDNSEYYKAAEIIKEILNSVGVELPFTDGELYAMVKLVAPMLIDPNMEGEVNADTFFMFLTPAFGLIETVGMAPLPHHFDTVIARLMALAPYPEMEGFDLTMDKPKAGDKASKAEDAIKKELASLKKDWLDVSVKWDTTDASLKNNKKYNLDVTFKVAAHTVPEDIEITINKLEAVEKLEVSTKDGMYEIHGIYSFTIGTPSKVTVSFDNEGHGKTPAAVMVDSGERLAVAITPEELGIVKDAGDEYKFAGWFDEEGNAWDNLTADEDMTLHAKWVDLISKVEIDLTIPKIGEKVKKASAPTGAKYKTFDDWFRDEHWDNVETVTETTGKITLAVKVSAKDGAEFKTKENENGDIVFDGTVTVNGEEPVETEYDSEDSVIYVTYEFEAQSKNNPTEETTEQETTEQETTEQSTTEEAATYTVTVGDGFIWAKGSTDPIVLTVKRSVEDDTCFAHFTGVEADGNVLATSDYSAKAGSTVVTLNKEYLEKLGLGEHVIKVLFDDGAAQTKITVKAAEPKQAEVDNKSNNGQNNQVKTGDDTNPGMLLRLMILSMIAMAGLAVSMLLRPAISEIKRNKK